MKESEQRKQKIYEYVLASLDLTKETKEEELQTCIEEKILEVGKNQYVSIKEKCRLQKEIYHFLSHRL